MFGIIRFILIGIVIGMANVIPGVSGGTLAVVFNIYDKFVDAITLNFKKLWANKAFVVPLLGGNGRTVCAALLRRLSRCPRLRPTSYTPRSSCRTGCPSRRGD